LLRQRGETMRAGTADEEGMRGRRGVHKPSKLSGEKEEYFDSAGSILSGSLEKREEFLNDAGALGWGKNSQRNKVEDSLQDITALVEGRFLSHALECEKKKKKGFSPITRLDGNPNERRADLRRMNVLKKNGEKKNVFLFPGGEREER